MSSRLRLWAPEQEITGPPPSLEGRISKRAPGHVLPVLSKDASGDPLAVIFGALSATNPVNTQDFSNDQKPPRGGFCKTGESDPAPPVSLLSVRRGAGSDTFRLELEVSYAVAEWLGRVGSAFWPVFGAVEEQLKIEQKQAERRAHFDERSARFKRAGRVGFHRIRKALSPIHSERILAELEARYGLERPAVEAAIKRHKADFRKIIAARRRAAIFRLKAAGLDKPEIAERCAVSLSLVKSVLRGPKS